MILQALLLILATSSCVQCGAVSVPAPPFQVEETNLTNNGSSTPAVVEVDQIIDEEANIDNSKSEETTYKHNETEAKTDTDDPSISKEEKQIESGSVLNQPEDTELVVGNIGDEPLTIQSTKSIDKSKAGSVQIEETSAPSKSSPPSSTTPAPARIFPAHERQALIGQC